MDETLLNNNYKQTDMKNNMFFFTILGLGYSILMGLIYYDIHNMNNNLNKIIDIVDIINLDNVNVTNIQGIGETLATISDCVINKYCRRV
tara:strand:- start:4 stop:273 length:270 start_codon:yes stop_codon:yes gene_type:complete